MDDYVSKPFEAQQLYSSVAQFFESDMVDGMCSVRRGEARAPHRFAKRRTSVKRLLGSHLNP
ncbi:unnamed protein product, partial [Musa acuminata var. zebrina]